LSQSAQGYNIEPGSPDWWLKRLVQRLMGRQTRYTVLENYAVGKHPVPDGDKRFVTALYDLQKKAKTNYIELVISAVTARQKVKCFTFSADEAADEDAQRIWAYNNMDLQSSVLFNMGAVFGDFYLLVTPPDPTDPNAEPVICVEDPKQCITENDPRYPNKVSAGLKLWEDSIDGKAYAALYLPDAIYLYSAPANPQTWWDTPGLTKRNTTGLSYGGFTLESVQPNPLGKVPLIHGEWQPSFGTMSRAEAESVFDIQDRINHTILMRLVVAKNQAFNQRWVTGVDKNKVGKDGRPQFKGAADAVWMIPDKDASIGQFEAADITGILAAIRDDVGDLAAVSKTPASYLMNRMVNVSGDTLDQDQSALVGKTKDRNESCGFALVEAMKMAFLFKGNTAKATEPLARCVFHDPAIRKLSEVSDSIGKLTGGGVALEVAMRICGFSEEDIAFSVKERDKQQAEQQKIADQQMAAQQDHQLQLAKTTGSMKAAGAGPPKPKPKASSTK
jgi:SPP1 Gp6-like portal protein